MKTVQLWPGEYLYPDFQLCPELQEISDLVEREQERILIKNLHRFLPYNFSKRQRNINEKTRSIKEKDTK